MLELALEPVLALALVLEPVPAEFYNGTKGRGVEKDGEDGYGVYQNGSVTHHQTYWFLQGLYKAGLRREANELFMKMTVRLRRGGAGIAGGLHSGVDWRTWGGEPAGYEGLLTEQFHFLLAAVTGYLATELTLDGPRTDGEAQAMCSDRLASLRCNLGPRAEGAIGNPLWNEGEGVG